MRILVAVMVLSACDGHPQSAPPGALPDGAQLEASTPAETSTSETSSETSTESHRPLVVRLLVGGLYHDYDTLPPALVARVAAKGGVEATISSELSVLEELGEFDVLWVHTCHDSLLSTAALASVTSFVERGGGLLAMHCAIASFRQTPQWAALLGAIVWGHEPYGSFDARVRGAHPALAGVPAAFSVTDEPYWVDDRSSDIDVLVETTRPLIGSDGGVRLGFEPQVWTRFHGAGRIFALTFGHDAASQENEAVVAIVHGGLLWAGKRL